MCREQGVEMHFSGLGSMMQPHFRKGPIERPYTATEKEEALRELYFSRSHGRRTTLPGAE